MLELIINFCIEKVVLTIGTNTISIEKKFW